MKFPEDKNALNPMTSPGESTADVACFLWKDPERGVRNAYNYNS